MRPATLMRFMHSRWMFFLMSALAILAAAAAWTALPVPECNADRGLLYPSVNLWMADNGWAAALTVALTIGIAGLKVWINRAFSLQRATSLLGASLFLAMCIAVPSTLIAFNTGVVLAVIILTCILLLFSTFSDPTRTPRIFLIFAILSLAAMTQYVYVVFIPVFVIGCLQMRIMGGRCAVAILLGLITPWWLVFGLGIAAPADVHAPQWAEILSTFSLSQGLYLLVGIILAMTLLLVGWVLNFPRMIAYNAQRRAYNGMLSVLALALMLGIALDYANVRAYAPLLFVCASYQLSHIWVGRRDGTNWVGAVFILFIFASLFACNIALK